MKIKCPSCGSPINPNAKFCENCGTPIKRTDFPKKPKNNHSSKRKHNNLMSQDKVRCPECGLRQDPRVGFCKRCGMSLKNLPLEFPGETPHNYHNERPPSSMPRPSINKTPRRDNHPNSRFDEGYNEYYGDRQSHNNNKSNNRFDDKHDEYPEDKPLNHMIADDYMVSDYPRNEIYHCPSCGVRLPSGDTVCPRCGYGQVTTKKSKSPILSALLSALIMGLGQLYNRQIFKGIGLFLIEVICIATSWLIIPIFFGFSFYIYGIIDAYEVAYNMTERVY